MGFGEAIKTCFSKYFDFSGRARRSEFWWFYLFTFIVSLIPFLGLIIALAALIPTYSAMARRLHDTDRSGWWILAPVVPSIVCALAFGGAFASNPDNPEPILLGIGVVFALAALVLGIILIVWLASDTQPGPNRFGPAPK